jgi:hypothetical protein
MTKLLRQRIADVRLEAAEYRTAGRQELADDIDAIADEYEQLADSWDASPEALPQS